jgi:hypothetical protein
MFHVKHTAQTREKRTSPALFHVKHCRHPKISYDRQVWRSMGQRALMRKAVTKLRIWLAQDSQRRFQFIATSWAEDIDPLANIAEQPAN